MVTIETEVIGCFNPFEMEAFRCPVCASNKFVELKPHGGVWCNECNATFTVSDTCDGLRKLSVRCTTEHVYKKWHGKDLCEWYGTVIWADDQHITWISRKNGKPITVDPTPT